MSNMSVIRSPTARRVASTRATSVSSDCPKPPQPSLTAVNPSEAHPSASRPAAAGVSGMRVDA